MKFCSYKLNGDFECYDNSTFIDQFDNTTNSVTTTPSVTNTPVTNTPVTTPPVTIPLVTTPPSITTPPVTNSCNISFTDTNNNYPISALAEINTDKYQYLVNNTNNINESINLCPRSCNNN